MICVRMLLWMPVKPGRRLAAVSDVGVIDRVDLRCDANELSLVAMKAIGTMQIVEVSLKHHL